jgi:hypothetical protein
MIIIPREKPAIKNMNSYYLDMQKLIEHYQGELGAGVVYFKAPSMQCALFFDEYQVVSGCCEEKKKKMTGKAAIDRIVKLAPVTNFSVSVYWIRPDRLYFWANLSNSEVIHSNLSTEFTDLDGLIRKMEAEKLTGYIDVRLNGDFRGGLLFFFNGEIIGGLSQKDQGNVDRSSALREELIAHSRESGGKFNVSRIFMDEKTNGTTSPAVAFKDRGEKAPQAAKTKPERTSPPAGKKPPREKTGNPMAMLESLLATMEGLVKGNRKIRNDFETLLNQKFVEKVDRYDFLDPFAGEFRYSGGKILYTGDAGAETLVRAISECVQEIAEANALVAPLRQELHPWRKKFANEVIEFDLRL